MIYDNKNKFSMNDKRLPCTIQSYYSVRLLDVVVDDGGGSVVIISCVRCKFCTFDEFSSGEIYIGLWTRPI